MLGLYSCLLTAALLLSLPWWWLGGKHREGWRERLGAVPRGRLRAPAAGQQVLWVHAVSVGEVLAAAPLVSRLREALPGAQVLVSTTTRTGQSVARARFGAGAVFYYPADFAFAVRAFLRWLRPSLVILVESEFWPRFLYECRRARVPVAVVNARISPRSWPRYRRLRALWRPLLGTLACVEAQTERDAERLRFLGAPRVAVGGNLKYDVRPPGATPLLAALRAALAPGVPVLVCGSTLAGEEELLLRTLPRTAILLLAPRHPERFPEVAALLVREGRPWVRLSSWRRQPRAGVGAGSVLLLDSVGELAPLYALATVAIVGGGFLHAGGHNPLEPAALGKAVVVGPGYANFFEIVQTLRAGNAIAVARLSELRAEIDRLLLHPDEAALLGRRAQALCAQSAGATERALATLLPLVQG